MKVNKPQILLLLTLFFSIAITQVSAQKTIKPKQLLGKWTLDDIVLSVMPDAPEEMKEQFEQFKPMIDSMMATQKGKSTIEFIKPDRYVNVDESGKKTEGTWKQEGAKIMVTIPEKPVQTFEAGITKNILNLSSVNQGISILMKLKK